MMYANNSYACIIDSFTQNSHTLKRVAINKSYGRVDAQPQSNTRVYAAENLIKCQVSSKNVPSSGAVVFTTSNGSSGFANKNGMSILSRGAFNTEFGLNVTSYAATTTLPWSIEVDCTKLISAVKAKGLTVSTVKFEYIALYRGVEDFPQPCEIINNKVTPLGKIWTPGIIVGNDGYDNVKFYGENLTFTSGKHRICGCLTRISPISTSALFSEYLGISVL